MGLRQLLYSGLLVGVSFIPVCSQPSQAPPLAGAKRTEGVTLEFRILADRTYDAKVVAEAEAPEGLNKPPVGYRWASLGETVTGTNPTLSGTTLTDASKAWERGRYAGRSVDLEGRDGLRLGRKETITIRESRGHSLVLEKAPKMEKVSYYYIYYHPADFPLNPRFIEREEPAANGVVRRWILVKLDPQNIGEGDLEMISIVRDERNQPAIDFKLKADAAERLGRLTREHLPKEGGLFKHRLAILIDNLMMSAPSINTEIRGRGIIELGDRPRSGEAERLLRLLKP
jgi:SecD/SecF fusion protein